MRFLLTMNMPSAKGNPVHQMTIEYDKAKTVRDFWIALSDNEFVICRLLYKYDGEWVDRGDVILNTSCIGKVQELVDFYGDSHDTYRAN